MWGSARGAVPWEGVSWGFRTGWAPFPGVLHTLWYQRALRYISLQFLFMEEMSRDTAAIYFWFILMKWWVTPVYCILFTVILILESEFEADVVWELQLIPTGQSPAGPALAKQM